MVRRFYLAESCQADGYTTSSQEVSVISIGYSKVIHFLSGFVLMGLFLGGEGIQSSDKFILRLVLNRSQLLQITDLRKPKRMAGSNTYGSLLEVFNSFQRLTCLETFYSALFRDLI